MSKLTVIGAGAWGTAFSLHLARLGHEVAIWCHEPKTAENIRRGENIDFLPAMPIPQAVRATLDLSECTHNAEAIFFAVPVQFLRSVLAKIDIADIPQTAIPVSLAKGIEQASMKTPCQIIDEALGAKVPAVALSGPSFAEEVAGGKPTVMVAGGRAESTRAVMEIVASDSLRVYSSDDRCGIEICSALKNVLALAAGMCEGLKLGDNSRAALIVRGLAELHRLVTALGGRPETAFGIAGLGDLVLTSTSGQSRNFQFGKLLAEGRPAPDIIAHYRWVAEGVFTAPVALELAKKHGVELPIAEAICAVIEGTATPASSAHALMTRPLKPEFPR